MDPKPEKILLVIFKQVKDALLMKNTCLYADLANQYGHGKEGAKGAIQFINKARRMPRVDIRKSL